MHSALSAASSMAESRSLWTPAQQQEPPGSAACCMEIVTLPLPASNGTAALAGTENACNVQVASERTAVFTFGTSSPVAAVHEMAGFGVQPFQQQLAAQHFIDQQQGAEDRLSSGAGRAASAAISADEPSVASTCSAGVDLVTASQGQSLCSGPDNAMEGEDQLSRELTREFLLEDFGCAGGPGQPALPRHSSQRASRHASSEPPSDESAGLVAAYEEEEEQEEEEEGQKLQLSLYDQVGGGVVMKSIINSFYDRVLGDERLAHFFDGVDMSKHRRKFLLFATYVMGGPDDYEHASDPWPQLYAAHERLIEHAGLREEHMDIIKVHFQKSLEEMGVGQKQVGKALAIVESTRRVIFPLEASASVHCE
ncbi:hypothetical protein ABPG77_000849 [Micractinium sp. CCAP 211/92]